MDQPRDKSRPSHQGAPKGPAAAAAGVAPAEARERTHGFNPDRFQKFSMNPSTAQQMLELELPRLRDSEPAADASRDAPTVMGAHVRVPPRDAENSSRKAWWSGDPAHGLSEKKKRAVLVTCGVVAFFALASLAILALDPNAVEPSTRGANRSLSEAHEAPSPRPTSGAAEAPEHTAVRGDVSAASDPARDLEMAKTAMDVRSPVVAGELDAAAVPALQGDHGARALAPASPPPKPAAKLPDSGLEDAKRVDGSASARDELLAPGAQAGPVLNGVDLTRPIAPVSE